MASSSKIVLCSDPTIRLQGAGVCSLISQTRFTERKESVKLYVQAVTAVWNANASLTHSQVVYDLNHTHALICEPSMVRAL